MNNTVAIVSNTDFAMQEIKSMLVLLREVDKVECLEYFDAEENIKEKLPGVIILHSTENDKQVLKLLRKIRKDERTSDIPVILYAEYANADYIVEAFDSGVTDILNAPLKDYELVIRVIWAIQKSENALLNQTRSSFLKKLGILDEKTGFYKEEFGIKFLETVVAQAKEKKQRACLLLVKTSDIKPDAELFTRALKASIRLEDTIAIKDSNNYYVFLSRAKLSGVYSVYERLLSHLGPMNAIRASVVEIKDEIFDDIINVLEHAIKNAPKNGEIAVVTQQDFLDMYSDSEPKEELEIAKILSGDAKEETDVEHEVRVLAGEEEENKIQAETPENEEPKNNGDKFELGLQIMQEKVRLIGPKKLSKKEREELESDERNAILYKQAYAKKLNLVAEPVLKKYAAKFQTEYPLLIADISVDAASTFMTLEKDDIKLNFKMEYDGLKKIKLVFRIVALGSEIESEVLDMDVMEFDYQKFDIIMGTVAGEYRNYFTKELI